MTESETTPRTPLIVEPLGNKPYPRMEVFVDGVSATVGIRMSDMVDGKKSPLLRPGYCSPTVKSILMVIDKSLMHEQMIADRRKDFEPTLKNFMKMSRAHNKRMMELAIEIEGVL